MIKRNQTQVFSFKSPINKLINRRNQQFFKKQKDVLSVFNQIESALLKEPSITDCRLLLRETESGQQELVAYVVPSDSFSIESLRACLESSIPEYLLPQAYVPVTRLPLTSSGEIDEASLTSIQVIDVELLHEWEEQLKLLPELDQTAVAVQEDTEKVAHLHLSDLLPSWKKINNKALKTTRMITQESASLEKPVPEKLAISHGETLEVATFLSKTLPDLLLETAKKASDQGIVYLQVNGTEIFQSYPALLEEAKGILAGLRKFGLQPQDKVIFQLENNLDLIPAFWACLIGGFVPVPISTASNYELSNNAAKKLQNAWQLLEQPLVLTSKHLEPQISKFLGQLQLEDCLIATLEDVRSCQWDEQQNWHSAKPEDLALLLLTSGSTGMPKGVMLSHQNIMSSIAGTSHMSDLTSQDISLNWLPLDHPGPLIRCVIRMVYLGCQQIHAPTAAILQDPLKWLNWIEHYKVTSTWSPNFALALLCDRAEEIKKRHWDLSSIKSWLNTAEPIVPQTAQKLLNLLEPYGLTAKAMHSSWGMAETSSGVTHSDTYLTSVAKDDSFTELGVPIPGISLRIVNEKNEIVPETTVGYLQVKGATVTPGYYQNSELNQENFTDDGWFKTGDLGFLEQGRLTITGRTKDVIIINGNNCYSHEIESVVEEIEGTKVSYTAACGIRQVGTNTDQLAIFFHTEVSEDEQLLELLKEIQKNVGQKLGISPSYLIPVEKKAIPKTSIGKIQRSQLVERFAQGEFDEIVKRIDILLNNENTLPNWFYRPIWRPKQAVTLDLTTKTGLTLIFLDSLGLGDCLCAELNNSDRPYVGVELGSDFAQLSSNRYRIDPKNHEHYQKLFELVVKNNPPIEQILHLWTYEEYAGEISTLEDLERAHQKGVYSLLSLVQALEKVQGSQTKVRLQIIASHSQATSKSDDLASERSPLLGVVKTIPQEMTWIDCRHLDLAIKASEVNAKYVLRELQVIQQEQEVAYRNGIRLISKLERVEVRQGNQKLPFKKGGMYLISGGLGGIGIEIAKYLLQQYNARLLLIGRTPLPERETWNSHLEQEDKVSERIKAYLSLEELEGEVAYAALDLSNFIEVQQVVEKQASNWHCQLDGVIHLAGTIQTRSLLEETVDSFATTLRPKVEGTWILHQLVKNQPKSLFISFSSVNGFFGRMTAGAYAAANRFLDSFCQYQQHHTSLMSYCFAWSMWNEKGLSRNYSMKDLNRARGYSIITPEQGLYSFLVGLRQSNGYLLVGLDESKRYIQQYAERKLISTQKLRAYFTIQTDQLSAKQFQKIKVCDRFGTLSHCEFRQIPTMPLTEAGEIDKEQLASTRNRKAAEKVAPRNELELQLTNIWERFLGVQPIGVTDNFFELGGNSLIAVRLIADIEIVWKRKLPLAVLFETPTVEGLAHVLREEGEPENWTSSLVRIQPNGSKPPLFCIHPVGGNVLDYYHLANYLGREQPVYGLQAQGLTGIQEPLRCVEDMANHYIQEIRTIQPKGPYFLAGYSFGGVVAFEMAQQLHAQGQKVALLGLFDVSSPILEPTHSSILKFIKHHLSNLKQLKRQERQKYVKDWLRSHFQGGTYKDELMSELSEPGYDFRVLDTNSQAQKNYQPQVYPGTATLFRANLQPVKFGDYLDLGWGDLVSGALEIHSLACDHYSVLREPHVRELAENLKLCLDKTSGDAIRSPI